MWVGKEEVEAENNHDHEGTLAKYFRPQLAYSASRVGQGGIRGGDAGVCVKEVTLRQG
jgi:hypothetical protein